MTKTILLVEDNPSDEKLTLRALKKAGIAHPIAVARDGAEALDFLFARGAYASRGDVATPGIVLLDLSLPRVGGLEVLAALRADPRTRTVPVIILTASAEEEDIARGYALGCNAYVRKPVEFAEFVEAARVLGLFWLVLNEPPPTGKDPP
jgi:two-component system response regulator